MAHALRKAIPMKVTDPNKETLRIIDRVTFHGGSASAIDLTFCTATPVATEDSEFCYEAVVAARLRFDIELAKAIVDGLSRQIAMVRAVQIGPEDCPAPAVERLLS